MRVLAGGRARRAGLGAMVAALAVAVGLGGLGTARAGGQPALAFAPSSSDFGSVGVGGTASEVLTLTNSGGSASGALLVAVAGSSAFAITSDACTGTSLGPNKSCLVTIAYSPT